MRRYSSRLMATKKTSSVCVCTLDSQRVSHFSALHHPILFMLYIQQRFDWWRAAAGHRRHICDRQRYIISPGKSGKIESDIYLNKNKRRRRASVKNKLCWKVISHFIHDKPTVCRRFRQTRKNSVNRFYYAPGSAKIIKRKKKLDDMRI